MSLGVASLDEYVDVKLIDAPSPEELVARLQGVSALGLRFVSAVPLEPEDPTVSSVVTGAHYVIALADKVVDEHGGVAALAARVSTLLAKSEAKLRRDISGVGKIVDVRRFLQALAVGGDAALEKLSAAGIVGRMVPLELTLGISPSGSAKVSEVVEALFEKPLPHLAVRVALLAGAGTPLDLSLFRRPAREPAAVVVSA